MFRKPSLLVSKSAARRRAARDPLSAAAAGRAAGIALGAALVAAALAATETASASGGQVIAAKDHAVKVVRDARDKEAARIAGASGGTVAPAATGAAAAPAPGPSAQSTPATASAGAADPAYHYEAAGRRDPFVSLDRASDPKGSARGKVNGLAGLAINEATVKGVVKSEGRLVAMVQAPDNKTYIVRPNDRLLDGAVRAVTPEAVVFVQQVSDPLSLVKQREIRKPLRPIEEGK